MSRSRLLDIQPVDATYLAHKVSSLSSQAQHSTGSQQQHSLGLSPSTSSLALPASHHSQHPNHLSPYAVRQFATYDDYLDSQVQAQDAKYLESEDLMRKLVELSARSQQSHDLISRDEFAARKRDAQQQMQLSKQQQQQNKDTHAQFNLTPNDASLGDPSAGAGVNVPLNALNCHAYPDALAASPFLQALAAREHALRSGKLTTIVFIRTLNQRGQEVSGYIDLSHRWFAGAQDLPPVNPHAPQPQYIDAHASGLEFALILSGERRLIPKSSDLSYYNWATQYACVNSSHNFTVKSDSLSGLLFKNKRDRKIISVDPQMSLNSNSGDAEQRTSVQCTEYAQAVFYDRSTRYHQ